LSRLEKIQVEISEEKDARNVPNVFSLGEMLFRKIFVEFSLHSGSGSFPSTILLIPFADSLRMTSRRTARTFQTTRTFALVKQLFFESIHFISPVCFW
jgi:hypothetical protein